MTVVVLIVVALALVIGLGVLIFSLMRRSQDVVPDTADRQAAETDRVVAVDDQGSPVLESSDAPSGATRDASAFESILDEELDELHPDREE